MGTRARSKGKGRRNFIIMASTFMVMAIMIVAVWLTNQRPRLIVDPESPDMIAKRQAPENGLNKLVELYRHSTYPPYPPPLVGPDPQFPELMSKYEPEPGSIGNLLYIQRPDDDPAVQDYVKAIEPVVDELISATQASYALWPARRTIWEEYDELGFFRFVGNYVVACALEKARYANDMETVFTYILPYLRFTDMLSRDGSLSDFYSSVIEQRTCLKVILELSEHASPDWLARMETELVALRKQPRPLDTHLEHEWRLLQNSLDPAIPEVIQAFSHGTKKTRILMAGGGIGLRYMCARTLREIIDHKEDFLRLARMSYPEFLIAHKTPVIKPSWLDQYRMQYADTDAVIEQLMRARASLETFYSGVMLTLAIEAFDRAHQTWPDSLAALNRDWAGEQPLDGYGNPFQYRVEDGGYQLYSYGRDGVDNGGPLDDRDQSRDLIFHDAVNGMKAIWER